MSLVPPRILLSLLLLAALAAHLPAQPATPPASPPVSPSSPPPAAPSAPTAAPVPTAAPAPPWQPRTVETLLEAQVELHRRGFSCGSIDDVMGLQTSAAFRAFQRASDIDITGYLDDTTRAFLWLNTAPLKTHTFLAPELAALHPVPPTWLEKSLESTLGYANALELVAERYRASPQLLRRLNPAIVWETVQPGATVIVPAVERITPSRKAAQITIRLEARALEVTDAEGQVIITFPVSIAQKVEKRPVGLLTVKVVIPDPNYTFDPEVYPESEEARTLGRKLIVPPGPNNPVGRVWIGLDLPGYGIHGTPEPEKVGRTESHGCFRLANWDALTLLSLATVGMPVFVEP